MGIASGVHHLQWLFSATFIVTLIAVPIHGWLNAHVPRARFIDWIYGFFALNMLFFALAMVFLPSNPWVARVFFVWLSVFNLFVVSVSWSLMADIFDMAQARRLFGFIAGGASAGGIAGPFFGAVMVNILSVSGLLTTSALMLGCAGFAKFRLMHWCFKRETSAERESRQQPVSGNPFSGFTLVISSPYLLCLAGFVMLLTTASTFLYFEQARLVAENFPTRSVQIRVFSMIDGSVQALSLICQLFVTGFFARRFGLLGLLTGVPLLIVAGFLVLAVYPTFAVIAVVMGIRRVGEYAFIRPGREMLFTHMPVAVKYRAKNFLDTVVYRAGDAISGWVSSTLMLLAHSPAYISFAGAFLALIWAGCGYLLAQHKNAVADHA